MKLRANNFGVFINGGMALFIAVILYSIEFTAISLVFLGIAVYHVMHFKKVELTQDAMFILYPFAIVSRQETILSKDLISYRLSGGHYTESGAVFIKYRKGKSARSMKIVVQPKDADPLEKRLNTWRSSQIPG